MADQGSNPDSLASGVLSAPLSHITSAPQGKGNGCPQVPNNVPHTGPARSPAPRNEPGILVESSHQNPPSPSFRIQHDPLSVCLLCQDCLLSVPGRSKTLLLPIITRQFQSDLGLGERAEGPASPLGLRMVPPQHLIQAEGGAVAGREAAHSFPTKSCLQEPAGPGESLSKGFRVNNPLTVGRRREGIPTSVPTMTPLNKIPRSEKVARKGTLR